MSSTPHPATAGTHNPRTHTPIGVDVGVKNLVTAAPVDDIESAITIQDNHIRKRHTILVDAMKAMQGAAFDTTEGQAQLFAALWHQLRPQIYDAAGDVIRYAQEYPMPTLVLEDISYCEASLWERRTAEDVGTWLLPALHHAIAVKANKAGIPVTYVDPEYTTQECHVCGDRGSVDQELIECTNADCPVDTASRDQSAAVSIAQRADLVETPVPEP